MDMLFDPGWAKYATQASEYSGYFLIALFLVSFVWTCANIGGMVAKASELDEAEAKKDSEKKAP